MIGIHVRAAALPLMIALCIFAQPSPAQVESHWLVGRWQGNLSGYIGKGSSARTLRVTAVSPEGTAQGMWYVTGQQPLTAYILVEGPSVKIATAGKSTVELRCDGDESLVGKYIPQDGETLPIKLHKIEGADETDK